MVETFDLNEREMDIPCRNLAMCGLLKKRGNIYRNSPYAATILNAEPPKYQGAYVELMKRQWTDWS